MHTGERGDLNSMVNLRAEWHMSDVTAKLMRPARTC